MNYSTSDMHNYRLLWFTVGVDEMFLRPNIEKIDLFGIIYANIQNNSVTL